MIFMFQSEENSNKKEASYYKKMENKNVQCHLCPVNCTISPDNVGACDARENVDGTLYTNNYGLVSSENLDPIEKKPLFNFLPGKKALSIGTLGCNMACEYCQNWRISQPDPEDFNRFKTRRAKPEEIVEKAEDYSIIAYTYNEPTIWYEFVKDTAKLAHKNNLKNVLVTNGYINEEPFRELAPYIDAMNIDIKSFDDNFYRKLCHVPDGKQSKETAKIAHQLGIHIELTYLIITDENDDIKDIKKFIDWVKSIDTDIPVHFSRYFPQYKMDNPATNIKTLEKAYELAKEEGLSYVYMGNVRKKGTEDTYCPNCGEKIVERSGYTLKKNKIKNGKCEYCDHPINGVF